LLLKERQREDHEPVNGTKPERKRKTENTAFGCPVKGDELPAKGACECGRQLRGRRVPLVPLSPQREKSQAEVAVQGSQDQTGVGPNTADGVKCCVKTRSQMEDVGSRSDKN